MIPSSMASMMFGAGLPKLTFLGTASDITNSSTYSFTGKSFGKASQDRLIVCAVSGYRDAGGTISSATIGGVAAAIYGNTSVAYGSGAFIAAVVPSGNTGTITINWSNQQASCAIAWYSITGLQSTIAAGTQTDAVAPAALSIAPRRGRVVICKANCLTSGTWTWGGTAGVVEDCDFYRTNVTFSTASKVFDEDLSSQTIIPDFSAAENNELYQHIFFI